MKKDKNGKDIPENVDEAYKLVNKKIDGYEAEIVSLKGIIDSHKERHEAMGALEATLEAKNVEFRDLVVKFDKAQDQLDKLEINGKKNKNSIPKTFKQAVNKAVSDKVDELKEMAERGSLKSEVILTMKAADMTIGNAFTGDVAAQQFLPGVFFDPDRSQHIRQFMTVLPTNANSIRYQQETAYDDGTAMKTEGAAAGQSDFDLAEQTAPVQTIAAFMTLSKEMLADTPFLEGYIRIRLTGKLMLKEDNQILYGSGVSPQLAGIDGVAVAYSDSLADSKVNIYDVLFSAVTQAMILEYRPNLILLHPNEYKTLSLTKDDNGAYLFPASVAGGNAIIINGALVIQTTAVTSDDFFVGDFRLGATLAHREDINISFSFEHASNFTTGNVTVLIEERLALPIHNPSAFIYGDISNALADGSA